MKINISKLALVIMISYCGQAYSGVPVIDGANLNVGVIDYVATAAEFAETASRWKSTVEQYKQELSTLSDQLASQTGVRDISALISDVKSIHSNISTFEVPTAEYIVSQGEGLLNSKAQQYFGGNVYYNRCQQRNIKIQNLCKSNQINIAKTMAEVDEIKEELVSYLEDIRILQSKSARSGSIKESADIANASAAKAAELELIKSKLEIVKNNYQITKAMAEEQEKQMRSEQAHNGKAVFYSVK